MSRGKSAVNRHQCSLVTVNFSRFDARRPYSGVAEMAEAAASALLTTHGARVWEVMGWGGLPRAPPLWVRLGVGVAEARGERAIR